jgi:predicted secreted hydrolase
MKRLVLYLSGIVFFVAASILLLCPLPGRAVDDEYLPVDGPCEFTFPRDHGAHPGYRVEWWYYTGNLATAKGERYGFQLTFFRTQISPPGAEKGWPQDRSAWRTNQLYFAHAACSAIDRKRFYHDEKMARGAVGLAGVEEEGRGARVFLGTWSALMGPEKHRLQAATDRFALDLSCRPLKPPVAHGIRGYSLKGKKPESASCYYSLPRLETTGALTIQGKSLSVQGTAWMDHEFSSAPLEDGLSGWDWFSIQLADNTELMIYLLRERGGDYSAASSGTFVDRSGRTYHLSKKDFEVDILDRRKSEPSGARYPSRWRIRALPLGLDLTVVSNMADQELITKRTTRVTYWEGSVSVRGRRKEKSVDGVGYVEMTGYAKPFQLLE